MHFYVKPGNNMYIAFFNHIPDIFEVFAFEISNRSVDEIDINI